VRRLDVVRDPLDEVVGVLLLDGEHRVVDVAERDLAAPERSDSQVATHPRVARRHHVLGVEHLLRELGHRDGPERLRPLGRERREADHEEVQPRERNHVNG